MYVSFETLKDDSRIWIYQADRKLSDKDILFIRENSENFLNNWRAHGRDLMASYQVVHEQFLIIAVDESFHNASGCSLDDGVHFIQWLEKQLSVNLFDRTNVAFLIGHEVHIIPLHKIKDKVSEGIISGATKTFNNLVARKGDLSTEWVLPAQESWLARYL